MSLRAEFSLLRACFRKRASGFRLRCYDERYVPALALPDTNVGAQPKRTPAFRRLRRSLAISFVG